MSKKHISILLLLLFSGVYTRAQQRSYLAFDYSVSQFKLSKPGSISGGLYQKLNRCNGNYTGASFHFAPGQKTTLGIGIGLSRLYYQKEWLGTFPESNQFGAAIVEGQMGYWSFPVSYIRTCGIGPKGLNRNYRSRKDWLHFGFSITYIPSFLGQTSFSATTSGGADRNTFLSGFHSDEQTFQHSLTIGFSDQLLLLNKHIRLDVEPYAGLGSSYFKENGTSINNFCFGLRMRIGISIKLPAISIEKEKDTKDAQQKKQLLKQKEKEIQEQLKQTPKQKQP